MGDEYYYDKFVPEFARLQKEREVWRMLARKNKVLRKYKIKRKTFLWKVSDKVLEEIISECQK